MQRETVDALLEDLKTAARDDRKVRTSTRCEDNLAVLKSQARMRLAMRAWADAEAEIEAEERAAKRKPTEAA